MSKWRKKPIVVEAFKWTGGYDQTEYPEWMVEELRKGNSFIVNEGTPALYMMIKTLEGTMMACPGDYIIKGVKGEIYPCKSDIFEASYDPVE